MFRFPSSTARLLTALTLTLAGSLQAAAISDPAGDFLPSFTGPHNGDLDVISAQVFYDGTNFTFTSTQNGLVGTTPGELFVWGIDRGAGTVGFPTVAPGVTFDSLFIINPAGGSVARDLVSGTATGISNITVSGSTVTGVVPASLLPTLGRLPGNYLVNLWPRSGSGGLEVISDFAPNNSDAAVTNVTPEPGSLSLLGLGSAAAFFLVRRRQSSASNQ